jgi:hypothetical protein
LKAPERVSGAPTSKPLPLGYGEAMLTIGPGRTRASFHQSRSFRITDATLPGWASANIASCRSPIGISSLVKIVGRSCRRPCGKRSMSCLRRYLLTFFRHDPQKHVASCGSVKMLLSRRALSLIFCSALSRRPAEVTVHLLAALVPSAGAILLLIVACIAGCRRHPPELRRACLGRAGDRLKRCVALCDPLAHMAE